MMSASVLFGTFCPKHKATLALKCFFVTICNVETCFFVVLIGNKIEGVWQQLSQRGVVGTGRNSADSYRGGRVDVSHHQTGDLWLRVSPWGAKILNGIKKICSTFLQSGFTDLDESWHDGGFRG